MARGNRGSDDDDDDDESLITGVIIGHLETFLSLKAKVNNHFYTLWSLKTI